MTVEIQKSGAAKQIHTVGNGKAVIDEHGYQVKITIDIDYNRLTSRQIPFVHKRIHELVDSALDTADQLRGYNPALIEVDDLDMLLPLDIDMDPNHQ